MKWLGIILGVIAALVLVAVIVGAMLPQSHVAVSSAQFRKPAADLFHAITDVGTAATWRKDVERIEVLPAIGNRIAWREISKRHVVNYEGEIVRAPVPGVPGRFISRITSKDLPYGGEWIIDVSMNGDASVVTLTENGEVYNPVFRFVSKYVMGHNATIDGYLRALGTHVGETVTPKESAPV
ncbi:MAG: hypothetical protein ABI664_09825 [bacterium]